MIINKAIYADKDHTTVIINDDVSTFYPIGHPLIKKFLQEGGFIEKYLD